MSQTPLKKVDKLLWRGRPREALALLQTCRLQLSNETDFYILRALANSTLGRFKRALQDVQRAERRSPEDPDVLAYHGRIHREAGRIRLARRILKDLVRKYPRAAYAWAELGATYYENPQRRMFYCQRALGLNPREVHALIGQAWALEDFERVAEAKKLWRRILTLVPDYAEGWDALGHRPLWLAPIRRAVRLSGAAEYRVCVAKYFFFLDRLPKAERECRNALRLNPREHAAWNELGKVLQYRDRFSDALYAHRRAIRLAPRNGEYRHDYASALMASGSPPTKHLKIAVHDLLLALRFGEDGKWVKEDLAIAYQELGNRAFVRGEERNARYYYRRCLGVLPRSEECARARALMPTKDFLGALRCYRGDLRRRTKETGWGWWRVAKCAAMAGKNQQAFHAAKRAMKTASKDASLWRECSEVLAYIGAAREAAKAARAADRYDSKPRKETKWVEYCDIPLPKPMASQQARLWVKRRKFPV